MRGLEKPYADRSHFLIFYRPCCYGISDKLYIYILMSSTWKSLHRGKVLSHSEKMSK